MANLTTLAIVRQSITRLALVSDDEINRLIGEASSVIESYCNRTFGTATFTETLDTDGSGQIFLKNTPITSITSITVGLPNGGTVLDASTYTFNSLTGEIRGISSDGFFPDSAGISTALSGSYGFQSVQIVYVGAYGTIPAAVVGRCLALVNRMSASNATDPSIVSKTMGKVEYTKAASSDEAILTNSDRRILSQFRIYG